MRVNFYDILSSHSRAYPKMLAEDYYALAYESEYGRVYSGDDDIEAVVNDLKSTKTDALEPFTVAIGGGYSRLNLAPIKAYLSAENIISLMKSDVREGSDEGFQRKLLLIRRSGAMGILPTAASEIGKCDGEPQHSALYKRLYGASYRIVPSETAPIVPALCLISEALGKAGKASVAIDGRACSGKTFAAKIISSVFASETSDGRLVINDSFGSSSEASPDAIKLFFDTDEDERQLRMVERSGESAWQNYLSSIRPNEDAYIEKYEPAINCDLVIRT